MKTQYINRGNLFARMRLLVLALIIHHSSFIIANAQNTYSLASASCKDPCGIETAIDGWIGFMCYNLGAQTSTLDPFSYNNGAINGDYYQFGKKTPGWVEKRSSTDPAAWGKTGTSNLKSINDPCPAGYKVPTLEQLTQIAVNPDKTWTGNGYKIGPSLYLPAAGSLNNIGGGSIRVSTEGIYWSTTSNCTLHFDQNTLPPQTCYFQVREAGASIRCVAQ